ncbi:hypothetical protein QBC47DRAFT_358257 [Echria macrotheca]|uniref:Uncharacterized protein n=1 Tax=Echria macrotheca TaxID=438768 RepID=A0AAJ0BHM8_9PEZI|nr:hypothetical protein QBC47DRAFT_358257 [Echria macrotheca]
MADGEGWIRVVGAAAFHKVMERVQNMNLKNSPKIRNLVDTDRDYRHESGSARVFRPLRQDASYFIPGYDWPPQPGAAAAAIRAGSINATPTRVPLVFALGVPLPSPPPARPTLPRVSTPIYVRPPHPSLVPAVATVMGEVWPAVLETLGLAADKAYYYEIVDRPAKRRRGSRPELSSRQVRIALTLDGPDNFAPWETHIRQWVGRPSEIDRIDVTPDGQLVITFTNTQDALQARFELAEVLGGLVLGGDDRGLEEETQAAGLHRVPGVDDLGAEALRKCPCPDDQETVSGSGDGGGGGDPKTFRSLLSQAIWKARTSPSKYQDEDSYGVGSSSHPDTSRPMRAVPDTPPPTPEGDRNPHRPVPSLPSDPKYEDAVVIEEEEEDEDGAMNAHSSRPTHTLPSSAQPKSSYFSVSSRQSQDNRTAFSNAKEPCYHSSAASSSSASSSSFSSSSACTVTTIPSIKPALGVVVNDNGDGRLGQGQGACWRLHSQPDLESDDGSSATEDESEVVYMKRARLTARVRSPSLRFVRGVTGGHVGVSAAAAAAAATGILAIPVPIASAAEKEQQMSGASAGFGVGTFGC